MTLGSQIAELRKKCAMTQEALAKLLDVTNQAVSKWEADQCCPDVMLLPKIADVFGVSLDVLFGRIAVVEVGTELPWEEDGALRIVLYKGRKLLKSQAYAREVTVCYSGMEPVAVFSDFNVECGDVSGDIQAKGYVECGEVAGNVTAESYVECGDVAGNANAGGYLECGDVMGSANSGGYIECNDVNGCVNAGGYVECNDVGGSVRAGTHVECGDVGGCVSQ